MRFKALEQEISLHELGRIIFQLNQRRGFKSNRKTDKKSQESGKILTAIKELKEELSDKNYRTYGEFLYQRNKNSKLVRLRANAKQEYSFYPDRSIIEEEFDFIWNKQAEYHHQLQNKVVKERIKNIILFQRDLRRPTPGKCLFFAEEERCPRALPSFQLFRLYQNLTNLRIRGKQNFEARLTRRQISTIVELLYAKNKASFNFNDIRKYIGDGDGSAKFTIETGYVKTLDGLETQNQIGRIEKSFSKQHNKSAAILSTWNNLNLASQDEIILSVLESKNDTELAQNLSKKLNIDQTVANELIDMDTISEYGRLSLKAMKMFIGEWQNCQEDYLPDYAELSKKLFDGHGYSIKSGFDKLPYYGELLTRSTVEAPTGMILAQDTDSREWIANPTVHVALNQLRLIVNSLIDRYGKPHEIIIELARDLKNNQETKKRITKSQREREAFYKESEQEIIQLGGNPQSRDDLIKWRLWKELPPNDRICIYTGKVIPQSKLFSNEIEIDHIIPFSRSLDDGIKNKLLVYTQANRAKSNQTPYEAFSSSPTKLGIKFDWQEIKKRVNDLFTRTNPETGEVFYIRKGNNILRENWDEDLKDKFLARHLTDTQYLSKASLTYLKAICPNVSNTPGILTALIRRDLGLDSILSDKAGEKNRLDHRHHAIDAFVIALTTRSYVQKISRESAKRESEDPQHFVTKNPIEPWQGYWTELKSKINKTIVSHKVDYGYFGRMMEDTAYGIVDGPNESGKYTTRLRIPIENLKKPEQVIDQKLKSLLLELQEKYDNWDLALKEFISNPPKSYKKLKSVAIVENNISLLPPIKNKAEIAYKGYIGGNNAQYVVYEKPDGTWTGTTVSVFSAYQENKQTPYELKEFIEAGYTKIMALYKNDIVHIAKDNQYLRIQKFDSNSGLCLTKPESAETRDFKAGRVNSWQKKGLEPVIIDPLGRPIALNAKSYNRSHRTRNLSVKG